MAAGSVIFYQHAIEDMMKGLLDLASMTLVVSLVSEGYVPNAKSHSVYSADALTKVVTAAGVSAGSFFFQSARERRNSTASW